jgi:hypothetical protein
MKSCLSRLVGAWIDIAHLLPPAIERVAEREAMDSNLVSIKNMRDFADLCARLERQHVSLHFGHLRRWEAAEAAWRRVRHDEALARFAALMNSAAYVNPPGRVKLLSSITDVQLRTHSAKMRCVQQLQSIEPGGATADAVEAIRTRIEEIDTADQAEIADLFRALGMEQERVIEVCGCFEAVCPLRVFG